MAVPKRRTTPARRNKRRAHDKIAKPTVSDCPQCGNPKQAYTVCKTCGHYRKREVIEILD